MVCCSPLENGICRKTELQHAVLEVPRSGFRFLRVRVDSSKYLHLSVRTEDGRWRFFGSFQQISGWQIGKQPHINRERKIFVWPTRFIWIEVKSGASYVVKYRASISVRVWYLTSPMPSVYTTLIPSTIHCLNEFYIGCMGRLR